MLFDSLNIRHIITQDNYTNHVFPKRSELYRLAVRRGQCHLSRESLTVTSKRRALWCRVEIEGRKLCQKWRGILLGLQRPRIRRSSHRWSEFQTLGHTTVTSRLAKSMDPSSFSTRIVCLISLDRSCCHFSFS